MFSTFTQTELNYAGARVSLVTKEDVSWDNGDALRVGGGLEWPQNLFNFICYMFFTNCRRS